MAKVVMKSRPCSVVKFILLAMSLMTRSVRGASEASGSYPGEQAFRFCYGGTWHQLREPDCPNGLMFNQQMQTPCFYSQGNATTRVWRSVCENPTANEPGGGPGIVGDDFTLVQKDGQFQLIEFASKKASDSSQVYEDLVDISTCQDECYLNLDQFFSATSHEDGDSNEDSERLGSTLNETQKMEITDQTLRLGDYLFDQLNELSKSSESGPELRIVTLFKRTIKILGKTCPHPFIPEDLRNRIMTGFLFLVADTGIGEMDDVDVDEFEDIMGALKTCEDKYPKFRLEGKVCSLKTVATDIVRILPNGAELSARYKPADFNKNLTAYPYKKYDPFAELAWKAVTVTHAECFVNFKPNANMHHKYTNAMEKLFGPKIKLRWENPTQLEDTRMWGTWFLADLDSTHLNFGACISAAYLGAPFSMKLDRPVDATRRNGRRRRRKRDTLVGKSSKILNNDLEKYWEHYQITGGIKQKLAGEAECFQTPEERDYGFSALKAECPKLPDPQGKKNKTSEPNPNLEKMVKSQINGKILKKVNPNSLKKESSNSSSTWKVAQKKGQTKAKTQKPGKKGPNSSLNPTSVTDGQEGSNKTKREGETSPGVEERPSPGEADFDTKITDLIPDSAETTSDNPIDPKPTRELQDDVVNSVTDNILSASFLTPMPSVPQELSNPNTTTGENSATTLQPLPNKINQSLTATSPKPPLEGQLDPINSEPDANNLQPRKKRQDGGDEEDNQIFLDGNGTRGERLRSPTSNQIADDVQELDANDNDNDKVFSNDYGTEEGKQKESKSPTDNLPKRKVDSAEDLYQESNEEGKLSGSRGQGDLFDKPDLITTPRPTSSRDKSQENLPEDYVTERNSPEMSRLTRKNSAEIDQTAPKTIPTSYSTRKPLELAEISPLATPPLEVTIAPSFGQGTLMTSPETRLDSTQKPEAPSSSMTPLSPNRSENDLDIPQTKKQVILSEDPVSPEDDDTPKVKSVTQINKPDADKTGNDSSEKVQDEVTLSSTLLISPTSSPSGNMTNSFKAPSTSNPALQTGAQDLPKLPSSESKSEESKSESQEEAFIG